MGFSWLENEDRRCRICLKNKDNYVYIFHHGKRNLSMKIMKLANIKIAENDGYPRTVCLDCSTELEKCFSFVELIKWADNTLKEGPKTFTPGTICNEDKVEFVNIKQEYEPSNIIDNENFVIGSSISGCDEMDIEYNIDVKKDCENEPLPEGDLTNTIQCGQNEGIPVPENNKIVDYGNIMPLNHVEIVENRVILNSNEVLDDPLAQKDPLLQIKSDPLLDVPSSEVKKLVPENSTSLWPGGSNQVKGNIGPKITQQHFVMSYNNALSSSLCQTNTVQGLGVYNPINTVPLLKNASTVTNQGVRINNISNIPGKSSINSSINDRTNLTNTKILLVPISPTQIGTIRLNINQTVQLGANKPTPVPECPKLNWNKETSSTRNIGEPKLANTNASHKLKKVIEPENQSFCSTCHVECGSVELLLEHKETKPFICRVCIGSFKTHLDLESHFITHPVVKCKQCSKRFHSRKDFHLHTKSSKSCSAQIKCDICNRMVSSRKILQNHIRKIHTNSNSKRYNCVVCDKSLKNPKLLHYHLVSVHTAFENVKCETCNKLFTSPEKLKFHVKHSHIGTDEHIPMRCTICDKIYKNKASLQTHMLTHAMKERLCEICGKSLKGKTIKYHMIKDHSETGKFVCKLCNQHFNKEILLVRHRRKSHSNRSAPLPVFCEICGKQYKSKTILKQHMLIHFDEKPFKCDICGAAFKQKVSLLTHGRIHSSVGKYECSHCGKSFKWKQTFDKHLKKCEMAIMKSSDDSSG